MNLILIHRDFETDYENPNGSWLCTYVNQLIRNHYQITHET